MMGGSTMAFVAILFFSWSVPEDGPYGGLLADPNDSQIVVEVMEFADESACEAFIDKVREDDTGAFLPYDGTTLSRAACSRL